MALSNIFREPQREITESIIGILVFAAPIYADYRFGRWLETYTGGPVNGIPCPAGMLIGIAGLGIILLVVIGLLFGTHAAGDGICNLLARRGLELRPRDRQ